MGGGFRHHVIARWSVATLAAVTLGGLLFLAGGPVGASAFASPTAAAEVSLTAPPTAEPSPPTSAEPSPTSSPSAGAERSEAPTRSSDAPAADATEPEVRDERALAQASATVPVAARDNAFVPVTITVEVGTTVVWENEGQNPHTVTADDRTFDSGTLASGDTFRVTFDEAGTVPYYCQIHGEPGSGMTGVVRVVAASEQPEDDGAGAPSVSPDELPRTGTGVVRLALLALSLTVAGALALRVGAARARG